MTEQVHTRSIRDQPDHPRRLVWDLPTRVFHWGLVVCLLGSYVTAKMGFDARQQHFWFGYTLIGLLAFRLIWGLVGPRHARFMSFLPTPSRIRRYTRRLAEGREDRWAGHNPLGALSVIALLGLLIAQAVSGLFMDDEILYAGPWSHAVDGSVQKTMESVHRTVINILLAFVALHLIAVVYYSNVRGRRIVMPMITGRADVAADDAIPSSRIILAVIIAAAVAGGVYWLVNIAPPPLPDDFF